MISLTSAVIVLIFGFVTTLPTDPILTSPGQNLRYQHVLDDQGKVHLADMWMTLTDLMAAARYDPATSNVYHLFTRQNPTQSQPIVFNSNEQLATTNFNSNRRTIVLLHGWRGSATSEVNAVLIPAFLAAEDVNVIAVDWSVGASSINYRTVIANTLTSGAAVARFIDWLNAATGATPAQYHIVGHGFGGHQAGIIGRNINGNIAYITGLNPALIGWVNNVDRFQPSDGVYTEVIHTNFIIGYIEDLAQVDFYPNGGISMPGCDSNECDDARSYFYFAESLSSGGFTGRQCLNYYAALMSLCDLLPGRLQMGGLTPKTRTGVYLLETNASPPFSQG